MLSRLAFLNEYLKVATLDTTSQLTHEQHQVL